MASRSWLHRSKLFNYKCILKNLLFIESNFSHRISSHCRVSEEDVGSHLEDKVQACAPYKFAHSTGDNSELAGASVSHTLPRATHTRLTRSRSCSTCSTSSGGWYILLGVHSHSDQHQGSQLSIGLHTTQSAAASMRCHSLLLIQ